MSMHLRRSRRPHDLCESRECVSEMPSHPVAPPAPPAGILPTARICTARIENCQEKSAHFFGLGARLPAPSAKRVPSLSFRREAGESAAHGRIGSAGVCSHSLFGACLPHGQQESVTEIGAGAPAAVACHLLIRSRSWPARSASRVSRMRCCSSARPRSPTRRYALPRL